MQVCKKLCYFVLTFEKANIHNMVIEQIKIVLKPEYFERLAGDKTLQAILILETRKSYPTIRRWIAEKRTDLLADKNVLRSLSKHLKVEETDLTEEKELINN